MTITIENAELSSNAKPGDRVVYRGQEMPTIGYDRMCVLQTLRRLVMPAQYRELVASTQNNVILTCETAVVRRMADDLKRDGFPLLFMPQQGEPRRPFGIIFDSLCEHGVLVGERDEKRLRAWQYEAPSGAGWLFHEKVGWEHHQSSPRIPARRGIRNKGARKRW